MNNKIDFKQNEIIKAINILNLSMKDIRVIESRFIKRDEDVSVNTKTVVYQKGVDGILKLMNKLKGVEVYEEEN